ncbi:MAG TPA: 3-hydroxyacyl-CoA dehydrogenase NAD-binding domain-containing protein [Acetobacteraceae bacterium]|nr:3-hydroxyacyl-CoA dehydrogenase NAD-binding domain-containing protein [Acetobacteraceae bacterium]
MAGIKKVAVIGAGVMGAGIAAQIANAGVPVLLLDIVPKQGDNRNAIAEGAVQKMLKTEPAPFMSKAAAKLVETGNIEDDLGRIAECDWVVEVVIERLDIKQDLYRRIDAVRRPGTAISSNTSTIPLARLIEGQSEAFARDFLITHFFNPPRYMRLLELVTGLRTDPAIADAVARFVDVVMGKSVVRCKDSPGFIANRLGIFWMQHGLVDALDLGLTVEEADAAMGKPFGIPRTGVFGLMDLVGIDLGPHVNASLAGLLPASDPFHAVNRDVPLVNRLIAEGFTGRKGKGGFYRLNREGGKRRKEALDLATGAYRPQSEAAIPEIEAAGKNLRALLSSDGKVGRYAWAVMGNTLAYAASLVPEAANDIVSIDEAMRLGYNWQWGPFELLDKLGPKWVADRLAAEGLPVPDLLRRVGEGSFYRVQDGKLQYFTVAGDYADVVRPEGVLLLADIKRAAKPVLKNGSAAVWDIGDGVLCFEFTSKSNSLDEQIHDLLGKTIKLVREQYKALVIYNEGKNFSVGANIGMMLFAANIAAWPEIDRLIANGQNTLKALKYAPFPVVGAPSGMALGGGCEVLLHSAAVQAHAESYVGLVEVGVGLIPGWGGCGELLLRLQANPALPKGPIPAPARAFEIISQATVSKSAAEARELGFLRPSDGITMNRDRLLADAKARALGMVEGYAPPAKPEFTGLPGKSGAVAMEMAVDGFRRQGIATPHDAVVAAELAHVLTGGEADLVDVVTEQQMLDLEREAFLRLVKTGGTLARVEHMLETGKPLRN